MTKHTTTGPLKQAVKEANAEKSKAVAAAKAKAEELNQARDQLATAIGKVKTIRVGIAARQIATGKPPTQHMLYRLDTAQAQARSVRGRVGGLGRSLKAKKVEVGQATRNLEAAQSRLAVHHAETSKATQKVHQQQAAGGMVGSFTLPQPPAAPSLPSSQAQDAADIVAGNINWGSAAQADAGAHRIARSIDKMDSTGLLVTPRMMTPSEAILSGVSPELVWAEVAPAFVTQVAVFPYKGVVS